MVAMLSKARGMIVSDLDGTLVANTEVSLENVEAIKSAKALGFGFVIATGRNANGVRRRLIDWNLEGLVDAIIGCNGSELIDLSQTEAMEVIDGIGPKVIKDITRILEGKAYGCCYYTPTEVHSNPNNPEIEYIAAELKVPIVIHEDINENFPPLQPKVIIFLHSVADRYFKTLLDNNKQEAYDTCFSFPTYLEILPVGMNKAKGLQRLIDRYHINPQNVLVMGDNDNDAEMLALVENSVVMGNGTPLAIAAAKKQVGDFEQHGVAEAIYWFLEQQKTKL